MTLDSAFFEQAQRFVNWLRVDALPFWADASMDPNGGFFEGIKKDGTPQRDLKRRTRIMSRQAYTYAHAAKMGWATSGKTVSDHGAKHLVQLAGDGIAPQNEGFHGFAHLLDADRTVCDPRRDAYDHAFAILAGVWRFHAFGQQADLDLARGVAKFLDRELGQTDGSYLEGSPPTLPRRQNPHMHLFEASLALANVTGADEDHERCHRLFGLFQRVFFDSSHGVVREFFAQDWSVDATRKDDIEPGHLAEWAWLLDQYQNQYSTDTQPMIDTLFSNAVGLGRNAQTGLLADVIKLGGPYPSAPTHRMWTQTEYLKAMCVKMRTGHEELSTDAAGLINAIFNAYITSAVRGGYFDQVDHQGRLMSDKMTPSTLYHLVSAAAEVQHTADTFA